MTYNFDNYQYLKEYAKPLKAPEREMLGRKQELSALQSVLMRPELSNVILLADAGSGKTALVQKCMQEDPLGRIYLEVDVAKLASGNINDMPTRVKGLFDEVYQYRIDGYSDKEIVLFMDEFHQIVQLSDAAVEAIKPCLADSGTRGVKVIAATTYKEFEMYVQPNQPLVERLYRLNLKQLPKDVCIAILKNMAETYGVADEFYDDSLFEQIYEYTELYVPASSQPRKSILMLDAMIGYHRAHNTPLDMNLLATIISESQGVNVAFKVDATTIKDTLNARVFSQELAAEMIARRLHIAVADLHDTSRTMSSFLFTGSTGVGKSLADGTLVPVSDERGYVKIEDIKVGDMVFDEKGQPTKVLGVFPQGELDAYEVTFSDGSKVICNDEHIWRAQTSWDKGNKKDFKDVTLSEIMAVGLKIPYKTSEPSGHFWWIPNNKPVLRAKQSYKLDPYVLGVILGDGDLTSKSLAISSEDEELINNVAERISAKDVRKKPDNYTWSFYNDTYVENKHNNRIQYKDVMDESTFNELFGLKFDEKHIPKEYLQGSISQRYDLLAGLMDTDGYISNSGSYGCVFYSSSKRLINDVKELASSLGLRTTFAERNRNDENHINSEYMLTFCIDPSDKVKIFKLSRKVNRAKDYCKKFDSKPYRRIHDTIYFESIEKLDKKLPMTCIYVDAPSHLYQCTENHIVTHNTEITKALADVLFEDQRSLLRFDMTEYSNPDSLERFRGELTSRVWERPFSIVLLDEIEKAAPEVIRILLQVLDDARLTDRNNREVSFKNAYIIMTTNAASEVYKQIAAYLDEEKVSVGDRKITSQTNQFSKYRKLIRRALIDTGDNQFPPELYNRIDEVVPFAPLNEKTLEKITVKKLEELKETVRKKHGVYLSFSPYVPIYLLYEDSDVGTDAGGARGVVRKLTTDVTSEVAKAINEHPNEKYLHVAVGGDMIYRNKTKRESTAFIKVQKSHESYYYKASEEFKATYDKRLGD